MGAREGRGGCTNLEGWKGGRNAITYSRSLAAALLSQIVRLKRRKGRKRRSCDDRENERRCERESRRSLQQKGEEGKGGQRAGRPGRSCDKKQEEEKGKSAPCVGVRGRERERGVCTTEMRHKKGGVCTQTRTNNRKKERKKRTKKTPTPVDRRLLHDAVALLLLQSSSSCPCPSALDLINRLRHRPRVALLPPSQPATNPPPQRRHRRDVQTHPPYIVRRCAREARLGAV